MVQGSSASPINKRKKDGRSKTGEYRSWTAMRTRCLNKNSHAYSSYGGRGIKIEWPTFDDFLKDMGKKPGPEYSLDRIDNNGNYCKENCRWATMKQQCNNTRGNKILSYKGKKYTMKQLADVFGLNYDAFKKRITSYKMSIEDAVERPFIKMGQIEYKGEIYSLIKLAKKLGINATTLHSRINKLGWDLDTAIATPARKFKSKL